jgi:hypothetical protein
MKMYSEQEIKEMIKILLPNYEKSELDLLTISAKEDAKGKAVTLEFHFGVDGYEWQ